MYATTLPRSNWLRRASIRLASYRHMPASSLDMHHLAFVINFQIHFVSLITRFNLPPHAFVNPYLSPSPLSSSITPSLFQYRLKTYPFQQILSTSNRLLLPIGLPSWWWDWTVHITVISLFSVCHFNFLFIPCRVARSPVFSGSSRISAPISRLPDRS